MKNGYLKIENQCYYIDFNDGTQCGTLFKSDLHNFLSRGMVKRFLQGLQKQAAVLRAGDGIFSVEYKTRHTAHAQLLRVIDVFPHEVDQRAVVEDVFEVMDVETDVGAELQ